MWLGLAGSGWSWELVGEVHDLWSVLAGYRNEHTGILCGMCAAYIPIPETNRSRRLETTEIVPTWGKTEPTIISVGCLSPTQPA